MPELRSGIDGAHRRAFVILGMHRSGTSAMTRTLSLLGAALPNQLMPAADNNPSGFWEPQAVADLNDEILQAQDSEWDDVFAFREHQYLSNFDRFYLGRAVELLDQQFNGSDVIVLKDPRISVLTAFWDRALIEAGYAVHYVIMVRNPLEVAESLRARDGFPREKSFLLWTSYMIAIGRDTRTSSRTFVSYDQLMGDWRSVRRRIEGTVGVPFPRDSGASAVAVDRHLQSDLRHHNISSDDLFSRADVPEQVKKIYQIFATACEGDALDVTALEAVEAELSTMDQLVGPVVADLKLSSRTLRSELAQLETARSGAEDRASSLTQELEKARSEYERAIAELNARISAVESETEGLRSQLELKQRAFEDVEARFRENQLQLAANLQALQEVETRLREAELRISAKQSELEQFDARLRESELEYSAKDKELQNVKETLRESELELKAKTAESGSLARQLKLVRDDLEAARATFAKSERRADELSRSLSQAQSANNELERRAMAHFQETATLSRIIQESEQLTRLESEKIRRIRELYDAVVSQPAWWSILSRSRRSQLQKARLHRLGVFDAETYLRENPDVAAADEDPLHHYLHHGIDEYRPTGSRAG